MCQPRHPTGVNVSVKRYLDAARAAGVRQDGGEEQLNDEVLGTIAEALRPGRRGGRGPVWNLLVDQRSFVEKLLDDDLTLTKIHTLLTRQGVLVPYRTLGYALRGGSRIV